MNQITWPVTNPFSTRFVRPGAIPYCFSEGQTLASLIDHLERRSWWGQIVGPHGSGKSTLLATLFPELENRLPILKVALHEDQRKLPALIRSISHGSLLIVDGFEQLGWWSQYRIKSLCRYRQSGLLITTHHDLGLPTLYCTHVSLAMARTVIKGLLPPEKHHFFDHLDLGQYLTRHQGSLREVLFDLYDLFETTTPAIT